MKKPRSAAPVRRIGLVLAGLALAACAGTDAPADGPITAQTLPLRDDYWPHRVHLTAPWSPESGGSVRPRGVLIRVDGPESARIDFGHRGVFDVPVAVTDLVEQANALRERGPDGKIGNVTRLLGGALGDPRYEQWRPVRRAELAKQDVLLVAARLDEALLREMAGPLARIDAREGVRVVLVAQDEITSPELLAFLRGIGWQTPFLRERFARTVTRGYLGEDPVVPGLMLITPNGRTLFEGPWPPDADLGKLLRALSERERERLARGGLPARKSRDSVTLHTSVTR